MLRNSVSVDRLHYLLECDAENGRLIWRGRPASDFPTWRGANAWRARLAGREALTSCERVGYRQGKVDGVNLMAHRVIWAMHYGEWPKRNIDHINGNKTDNRISNLRLVTQSENCMNRDTKRMKGTTRRGDKWRAQIKVNGRNISLGTFNTEAEAALAYDAAAKQHFGEYARTNF